MKSPNPTKKYPHSTKGFSLVEVMVGLTLMALVFTGVFSVFRSSLGLIESSRDQTRVAQILQSELEGLRSKTWNYITGMNTISEFTPQGKFVSAYADQYTCYRFVFTPKASQREIVLICTWYDSNKRYHWKVFRTLFTENGLNDYYYRSF